ncbi:MAG TPA: transposase [Rhodothermales bacterium]|nr:transposase [Rhodothermales bacterium]
MHCNAGGEMIAAWWHRLSNKFPTVETDAFVIMPNHLHGMIILHDPVGVDPRVHPTLTPKEVDAHMGASLPVVMQWFKTMTTNAYIKGVQQHGWTPFCRKLWQRSYYEHIVRDQRDFDRIREYIHQNPAQWYFDRAHTAKRD